MSNSYCNLLYHLVFSTKQRKPWLKPEYRPRVHEYLGGAIKNQGGIPLNINGTEDHVHLFVKLRQDVVVCDILRNIKSNSSGWIHKTFQELTAFGWQDGYGAFTVSASQSGKLNAYINGQEKHHRKISFKEEFTALLKKHGVEYNERYIWK